MKNPTVVIVIFWEITEWLFALLMKNPKVMFVIAIFATMIETFFSFPLPPS
jgi:hypothetical protein